MDHDLEAALEECRRTHTGTNSRRNPAYLRARRRYLVLLRQKGYHIRDDEIEAMKTIEIDYMQITRDLSA